MAKARIVLDIDEDLKQAFKDRIEAVKPNYKMTSVLAAFMYETLTYSNEEIRLLVDHGITVFAANQTYKKLVQDAIENKLLPESFKIGNSRYKEIQTILVKHSLNKINYDEAQYELNRLRKEAYLDSSEGRKDRLLRRN